MSKIFVILFTMFFAVSSFCGTFTVGHDWVKTTGQKDTTQNTFSLKYGFEKAVSEDFSIGVELGTGNNPRDYTLVLSNGADAKDFDLRKAFVKYTPEIEGLDKLTFVGGKFARPFMTASELAWDHDLTFEGWGFQSAKEVEGNMVHFNGGAFVLDEFAATNEDPSLTVLQVGSMGTLEEFDWCVLFNHLSYSYVENHPQLAWAGNGNDLTAAGNYLNDYDAFELSGELVRPVGETHMGINFDYLKNYDTTDDAYLLGVNVGDVVVEEKGDWKVSVNYRRLEPDSVLAIMTDSDFHMGATNAKGYELAATYGVDENVAVDFDYIKSEDLFSNNKIENTLWRLELVVEF